MAYEIVDNFLDKTHFTLVKNFIESSDISWYWNQNVAFKDSNDAYYFTHTFYENNSIKSECYQNIILPIIERLNVKALIRAKANLYPNIGRYLENAHHTDYDYKHIGAVLYINNNNGYTILNNGKKIESIENRLLKFTANDPHQSTHCTDAKRRININLNYF